MIPDKKMVLLDNREPLIYEKLLIATGARPRTTTFPGGEKEGVFVLRTFQNAEKIRNYAKGKRHAVIVGGGPVSLKAAWALRELNLKVTIVISSNRLLSRLVDIETSLTLEKVLLRDGCYRISKGCDLVRVCGKEKVEAVELNTGDQLSAELVILGKGVVANKELVAETGIATAEGILADAGMETSIPDIYAAGDVAQTYDVVREKSSINAIWPAAFAQGKVAGLNMGEAKISYAGTVPMNVLEVGDMPVAMVGVMKGDEVAYRKPGNNIRKLYLSRERIMGALFLGDLRGIGYIHSLIRNKIPLVKLPSLERLLENAPYTHKLSGHNRRRVI